MHHSSGDMHLSEVARECWEWHAWYYASRLVGYYQCQEASWIPRLLATPRNTGVYEETPQLVWDDEFGSFIPVEMKYPRPHALRIAEYRSFVESLLSARDTHTTPERQVDGAFSVGCSVVDSVYLHDSALFIPHELATRAISAVHPRDSIDSSDPASPRERLQADQRMQSASYLDTLDIASQEPMCLFQWIEETMPSWSSEVTHTSEPILHSATTTAPSSSQQAPSSHATLEHLESELSKVVQSRSSNREAFSMGQLTGKRPGELLPHLPPPELTATLLRYLNASANSGALNRIVWINLLQRWVCTFDPLPLAQIALLKKKSFPQKYALSHGFSTSQDMTDFLRVVDELVTLFVLLQICGSALSAASPVSIEGERSLGYKHASNMGRPDESEIASDSVTRWLDPGNDSDTEGVLMKSRLRETLLVNLCRFKALHISVSVHFIESLKSHSEYTENGDKQCTDQINDGDNPKWSDEELVTFLTRFGSYVCVDLVAPACVPPRYPAAFRFVINLAAHDPEVSEAASALLSTIHPTNGFKKDAYGHSESSGVTAAEILALGVSARRETAGLQLVEASNWGSMDQFATSPTSPSRLNPAREGFRMHGYGRNDIPTHRGSVTRGMYLMEDLLARISERTSSNFDKLYCTLLYVLPVLLLHKPGTASEVLGWLCPFLPAGTARWLIHCSLQAGHSTPQTTQVVLQAVWGNGLASTESQSSMLSDNVTMKTGDANHGLFRILSQVNTVSRRHVGPLKEGKVSIGLIRQLSKIQTSLLPTHDNLLSSDDKKEHFSSTVEHDEIREMELTFYFNYLDYTLHSLYRWHPAQLAESLQFMTQAHSTLQTGNNLNLRENQHFGVTLLSWLAIGIEILDLNSKNWSLESKTVGMDVVVSTVQISTSEERQSVNTPSLPHSSILLQQILSTFVNSFSSHVNLFEDVTFSLGNSQSCSLAQSIVAIQLAQPQGSSSGLLIDTLSTALSVAEPKTSSESFSYYFCVVLLCCLGEMSRLLSLVQAADPLTASENGTVDVSVQVPESTLRQKDIPGALKKQLSTLSAIFGLLQRGTERALDSCHGTRPGVTAELIDLLVSAAAHRVEESPGTESCLGRTGPESRSHDDPGASERYDMRHTCSKLRHIDILSSFCKLFVTKQIVHT